MARQEPIVGQCIMPSRSPAGTSLALVGSDKEIAVKQHKTPRAARVKAWGSMSLEITGEIVGAGDARISLEIDGDHVRWRGRADQPAVAITSPAVAWFVAEALAALLPPRPAPPVGRAPRASPAPATGAECPPVSRPAPA